jgi:hypothetical protein
MSFISVAMRGIKEAKNEINKFDKLVDKNRGIALKSEAFDLRKKMLQEIKKAAPGGQGYDPLSFIARAGAKGLTSRKPFTGLHSTRQSPAPGKGVAPVRYKVHDMGSGVRKVTLGFLDDLSSSWKRLMKLHQEGGTIQITEKQRRYFRDRGAYWKKKYGKKSKAKLAKVFFLRKDKTTLKIPKRDIVNPFWAKYKAEAAKNIQSKFYRKMKGERI